MKVTNTDPVAPLDTHPSENCTPAQPTLGDLLYDLLSRRANAFLLLFLALPLSYGLLRAHRNPLWYDEIFSVIVAMQPTWHRFAQAMPADGNPPLFALLVRLSMHLFGGSELATRLPSLAAFTAALVAVYIFVRRETDAPFALLAVALVFSEPGWKYSYEGRPYALLLGCMMLAMVSWQSAVRAVGASPPRPRRLALAGMALGVAGSIGSHYIGIVEVGIPLLFGEAIRLYRSRRPDWPLLATGLVAAPAFAIVLPMLHRTNRLLLVYSSASVYPLTLAKIKGWGAVLKVSWPVVLDSGILRIIALLLLLTWAPRIFNRSRPHDPAAKEAMQHPRVSPHILAAALGAALLIPITWVLLMLSSGYYDCRYGIGSIAGIAMLASLLPPARGRRYTSECVALLAVLTLNYARPLLTEALHPTDYLHITPLIASDQSGLPIAVADPLAYVPMWWYAPAAMQQRIVYLADQPAAIKSGYIVTEAALMAENKLLPAPLKEYASFIATHDHFLLDLTNNPATASLKDRLEVSGYRTTLLRADDRDRIYDVQRATASPARSQR